MKTNTMYVLFMIAGSLLMAWFLIAAMPVLMGY